MRTLRIIAIGSLVSLAAAGPNTGGCQLCSGSTQAEGGSTLDRNTIDMLIAMREEEKLARDVYLKLGELWNEPVFGIERSERRHMNAIKGLLDQFGIEDPIKEDSRGVFVSERYQKLHDELVERGSKSRVEALRVGALIEELDLVDLREAAAATEDESIRRVLDNLRRATRNHLRAFASALREEGVSYEAKHLSQADFDAIASAPHERGGQGNRPKRP